MTPPPTDTAEIRAWLRLLLVPGLGRESARRLLAAFGSPQHAAAAAPAAAATVIGAALAQALAAEPDDWADTCTAVERWLGADGRRWVLTIGDSSYPQVLLESPDPPLLLYGWGEPAALAQPAIAIVGSRRPTAQGSDNARRFARALGMAGHAIVSGLAAGIDAAAHLGALDVGAATVAVMGTGPDQIYPAQHRELAERIVERGALLTEYHPGMPPLAQNFPRRNRIIAGLARGTLVVEAALRSGSLVTARLANEAGREVFAIPGSIQAEQSRGCHALIRDGATLVEDPAEVLQAFSAWAPVTPPPRETSRETCPSPPPPARRTRAAQAPAAASAAPARRDGPAGDPLLAALGHDPTSLDQLQARTGEPTAVLLARLLELELEGRVAHLPGGLYQQRGLA